MSHLVNYTPPDPPQSGLLVRIAPKLHAWVQEKFPRRSHQSSLCEGCQSLDLASSIWRPANAIPNEEDPDFWTERVDTSNHTGLSSLRNLRISAAHCECCNIIYNALIEEVIKATPVDPSRPTNRPALEASPVMLVFTSGRISGDLLLCSVTSEDLSEYAHASTSVRLLHTSAMSRGMASDEDRCLINHALDGTLPPDPTSKQAIERLRGWLNSCDQHDSCRAPKEHPSGLPARLIYVGTLKNPELRMLEIIEKCPPYLALSYCWGPSEQFKLTSGALDEFRKGITEAAVSKSARDAIFLARNLQIEHVWIDALCIVQDNEDERQKEAIDREGIYRDARLVVYASRAATASSGFLQRRLPLITCYSLDREAKQQGKRLYVTLDLGAELGWRLQFEPLTQQATSLKGCLLPRRRVFFTRYEMIWQCAEGVETESGKILQAFP